jgi:hypothetical protein
MKPVDYIVIGLFGLCLLIGLIRGGKAYKGRAAADVFVLFLSLYLGLLLTVLMLGNIPGLHDLYDQLGAALGGKENHGDIWALGIVSLIPFVILSIGLLFLFRFFSRHADYKRPYIFFMELLCYLGVGISLCFLAVLFVKDFWSDGYQDSTLSSWIFDNLLNPLFGGLLS